MRVLVTGSRDWTDEDVIREVLTHHEALTFDASYNLTGYTLVHGDCPTGADAIADKIARELGWKVEKHPADWKSFGKYAGPKRNKEMVNRGADVVFAFPKGKSKGTWGCISFADQAELPVYIFEEVAPHDIRRGFRNVK